MALLIIAIFLLILRGNKNRKKRELIEQEEKSQRAFSQQLLQSQEDEKTRISRELHDSVGQDLILLKNKAQSIKDQGLETSISEILNNVTPMWSRYRGLSTRNDNTIIQCPPNITGIKFVVDQFDPGTLITINLICI